MVSSCPLLYSMGSKVIGQYHVTGWGGQEMPGLHDPLNPEKPWVSTDSLNFTNVHSALSYANEVSARCASWRGKTGAFLKWQASFAYKAVETPAKIRMLRYWSPDNLLGNWNFTKLRPYSLGETYCWWSCCVPLVNNLSNFLIWKWPRKMTAFATKVSPCFMMLISLDRKFRSVHQPTWSGSRRDSCSWREVILAYVHSVQLTKYVSFKTSIVDLDYLRQVKHGYTAVR